MEMQTTESLEATNILPETRIFSLYKWVIYTYFIYYLKSY